MKRYKLWLYMIWIPVAIGWWSCSDNEPTVEEPPFNVTKTTANFDHNGGNGTIELSSEGVQAQAGDAWLQVSVQGRNVSLTAQANKSYESRTTVVTMTKDGHTEKVPVTQMGIISITEVTSYDFPKTGGRKGFLWKTDQPYEISGADASWLSYRIVGDSLIFTAKALGLYDDTCSSKVKIKAGQYYETTVTFRQVAPYFAYEWALGDYTMEYRTAKDSVVLKLDVSLVQKAKNKTYTLKGLDFNLTVLYVDTAGIAIKSQRLTTTGDEIWLAAWQGGYGGNGFWPNTKFGVISRWNKDKRNIEFTMVADGTTDEQWKDKQGHLIKPGAFLLRNTTKNTTHSPAKAARLVDMKFIKKH